MSLGTATAHVPAFKRREAARRSAAINPTPEKMRAQLGHCQRELEICRLQPDRKQRLLEQIAKLKAQLGDE